MIVFVAGMPRSGSTFSFNIVRAILARRGSVFQKPAESLPEIIVEAGDAAHVIMKAHGACQATLKMIKEGSVKVICTIRSPEDAIASWIETFDSDLDQALAVTRSWYDLYEIIRQNSLTIPYQLIDLKPLSAARQIARYVWPESSDVEIAEAAELNSKATVFNKTSALSADAPGIVDAGFSHYDSTTFYHRRHVTRLHALTAAERIGADAVAKIRRELPDYTAC